MKANELMIGDWIKLKKDHCKFLQLTAIDETYNSINYFDGDAEGELTLQLTAIEPIPLTPEILEKNGFIYQDEKVWGKKKEGITIELDFGKYATLGHKGFLCIGGNAEIHHVHEFQRALRCVGLYELADSIKL